MEFRRDDERDPVTRRRCALRLLQYKWNNHGGARSIVLGTLTEARTGKGALRTRHMEARPNRSAQIASLPSLLMAQAEPLLGSAG